MKLTLDELWSKEGILKRDSNDAVVIRFPIVVQLLEGQNNPRFQQFLHAGLIEISARIGLETLFVETPMVNKVFITEYQSPVYERRHTGGIQVIVGWSWAWMLKILEQRSSHEEIALFGEGYDSLYGDQGLLWLTNDGTLLVTGKSPRGLLSAIRAFVSDNWGQGFFGESRKFVVDETQDDMFQIVEDRSLEDASVEKQASKKIHVLHEVFSNLGIFTNAEALPEMDAQIYVNAPSVALDETLSLAAKIGLESGYLHFPCTYVNQEKARASALIIRFSVENDSHDEVNLQENRLEFRASTPQGLATMLRDVVKTWFHSPSDVDCEDWRGKLAAWDSSAPDIRLRAKSEVLLTEMHERSRVHLVETPAHLRKVVEPWCVSRDIPLNVIANPILFSLEWFGQNEWELMKTNLLQDVKTLMHCDEGNQTPQRCVQIEIFTTVPKRTFEEDARAFLEDNLIPKTLSIEFIYRNVTKAGLSWFLTDIMPILRTNPQITQLEILARKMPEGSFLELPQRFLQEFFPVDVIVEQQIGISRDLVTLGLHDEPGLMYIVFGRDANSEVVQTWTWESLMETRLYMPGQSEHKILVPAAGYRIVEFDDSSHLAYTRGLQIVPTVYTQFWEWYQNEIIPKIISTRHTSTGPTAFSRLEVDVWTNGTEEHHGIYEEVVSWPESLHEDVYFYTLHALREHGDAIHEPIWKTPGLIVPQIHLGNGIPHAQIRTFAYAPDLLFVEHSLQKTSIQPDSLDSRFMPSDIHTVKYYAGIWTVALDPLVDDAIETIMAWLNTPQTEKQMAISIRLEESILDAPGSIITPHSRQSGIIQNNDVLVWLNERVPSLPGRAWIVEHSFQGRPIVSVELYTSSESHLTSRSKHVLFKPTLLVLARHHANEVSSTNSALNLLDLAMANPSILNRLNLVVVPVHNTDGTALHRSLMEEHPHWKHHAARFNACGYEFGQDYFKEDTQFGESRVAMRLWRLWRPDIVIDDHGIPSHEWIQPFSGYNSPPLFPVSYWIPQAQIYTIWRDLNPNSDVVNGDLIDMVSRTIAHDAHIHARNTEFLQRYKKWGQAFCQEKFPVSTVDGVITYRWQVKESPNSKDFIGRFPTLVTADIVTEVNDETVDGDALREVVYAHSKAHEGVLSWLNAVKTEIIRTHDRSTCSVRIGVKRQRPLF